uniref:Fork-head domain-containing protein n=1 Tax=Glossina palpalis gambiensis TaxID=67801 RepID=A0A1B0BZG7_9MUSC
MATGTSKIIQSVNHQEFFLSATFSTTTAMHQSDCDERRKVDGNECSVTFTVTNLEDVSAGHAEEGHLLIHLEELVNKEEYKCDQKDDEKDDEEEKDLTSLTWLTELRNQPITLVNMPLDEAEEIKNKSQGQISKNSQYMPQETGRQFCQFQCPVKKCDLNNGSLSGAWVNRKNREETEILNHQKEVKRPTPIERFEVFLNKVKRDLEIYQQSANAYQNDANEKPPFNYSHIIGMAMLENGRRVTLQQICAWIELKFAFFRVRKKWNNSIRHNLSLHPCFRKIGRNKDDKGKGGYWELAVDPKKCDRKRIRNRKSILRTINKNNNSITNKSLKLNDMQRSMLSSYFCENNYANQCNERDRIIFDIVDARQNGDGNSITTANTNKKDCFLTSTFPQNHQQQAEIDCHEDDVFIAGLINKPVHETSEAKQKQYNEQGQDYTFGTIIISTSQMADLADIHQLKPTAFDYIINHAMDNEASPKQPYSCPYAGDENAPAYNNLLTSQSFAEVERRKFDSDFPKTISESTSQMQLKLTQERGKNVIVEQLVQPSSATCVTVTPGLYTINTAFPTQLSTSTSISSSKQYHASTVPISDCCQNSVTDNFSYYVDGIDEAFQYLRSIDTTRNEDTLDNFLDISVGDY